MFTDAQAPLLSPTPLPVFRVQSRRSPAPYVLLSLKVNPTCLEVLLPDSLLTHATAGLAGSIATILMIPGGEVRRMTVIPLPNTLPTTHTHQFAVRGNTGLPRLMIWHLNWPKRDAVEVLFPSSCVQFVYLNWDKNSFSLR